MTPTRTLTKTDAFDFSKLHGLIPAMVQDAATGDVLMLGFMNDEACRRTLSTGYVTFFSRTRNQLWTKGETSGNRLRLVSATTDCDRDTLLLQVEVEGAGLVCHEGTRSCFTKVIVAQPDRRDDACDDGRDSTNPAEVRR